MKKVWVVYEARSETEGKVYIGRTQQLRDRKRVHKSWAKHHRGHSHFHQAMQAKGYTFVYLKGGDLPCS